jgi:DNA-binding beta-propeller fold protein YncE
MLKTSAVLLLAALAACATDPDTMMGDDQPPGGDDAPPFTNGVSMLSGHAEAGYVDGPRGKARFANPVNCAYRDGKVYVADFDNNKIRVVDAETGNTSTLISKQGFQRPFALAFASDGTLFVSTDRGPQNETGMMAGTIWRVDVSARDAAPIAPGIGRPRGLVVLPNGKLAISDYQNHVVSIVDPVSGAVTPLAGAWQVAGMVDAAGTGAMFNQPYGLAVKGNNLIVADYGNNRLREVSVVDGAVRTLAGIGAAGFADGAMASAKFAHPQGMAVMSSGDVYVTDLENFRIRKVAADVTTAAGSGEPGYLDSDSLLEAQFYGLEGICANPDGSKLFVADGGRGENVPYNRIRSIKLQ